MSLRKRRSPLRPFRHRTVSSRDLRALSFNFVGSSRRIMCLPAVVSLSSVCPRPTVSMCLPPRRLKSSHLGAFSTRAVSVCPLAEEHGDQKNKIKGSFERFHPFIRRNVFHSCSLQGEPIRVHPGILRVRVETLRRGHGL